MAGRHNKAATSFDVARLAGVSRSAVSRTFTEGASVAPETRLRVMQAAEALRYRPNLAARSLITRRSMIVALAISHLDNQFYPSIVQRISENFAELGYRLLLYVTHGEGSHEPLLGELRHFGVDGLILASRGFAPELLAECALEGLPVVMMNNASSDSPGARVIGDNRRGAARVARFLIAGGHDRFAYLSGDRGVSSSEQRLEGYAAALSTAGLGPPAVIEAGFEFDRAYAASIAALAGPSRPDALFCANDNMAFAALQAARQVGLQPGREISIVGFDNVTISGWPDLALTTYSQPPEDMAASVVDVLTTLMDGAEVAEQERLVAGHLIVRGTARKPQTGIFAHPDGSLSWHDEAS
jgi:DNA-binding LacI/PurR family transcriptional regulator